ncbi:MAG: GtrA family protein, partial [Rhodanobacter sp.]
MRSAYLRISDAASRMVSKSPICAGEAFRFLIGGVLNLVVSYGGYLLLLHWLHYEAAYAIAYVVSIAVSYVFSALFVFRQPMRARAALRFPLVYLVQFLLGLILLRVLIDMLHSPAWLAPLLV